VFPQTLNHYSYAANNPETLNDPTGLHTDEGWKHATQTSGTRLKGCQLSQQNDDDAPLRKSLPIWYGDTHARPSALS
jgi:hypothetical protein